MVWESGQTARELRLRGTATSVSRMGLRALLGGCVAVVAVTASAIAGPYDEEGIPSDSSLFAGWATEVLELIRGPQDIESPDGPFASYGTASAAIGVANNGVVSLGDGGSATLTFDVSICNGDGPDLAVFENGFGSGGGVFAELAYVEVSSNGTDFFSFPSVSLTQTDTQVGGFGVLDPTDIYDLAGKHVALEGTPFDLEELEGVSSLLDVDAVTHVRVTDVVGRITSVGSYTPSLDSLGNIINDPYPTAFTSCGFDLDAVGAINVVPEPSTLGLLALGTLVVLRRRGRGRRVSRRAGDGKPVCESALAAAVRTLAVVGAIGVCSGGALASDPWADSVVYDYNGTPLTFGPFHSSSLWNDPEAVVGKLNTIDCDDTGSGTFREVHMCWPAWYKGSNDSSLIGQPYDLSLGTNNGTGLKQGGQIVVAFDEPIVNNADDGGAYNWGVDFIVHGNSFFVGDGTTYPDTNMETYGITTGAVFAEPVTVSVAQSLDGPWYTFTDPTADNYFPTQPWAWDWDADDWSTEELDWTKPVDPSLTGDDFGGLSVAEAIDLYGGSAGGTGFDLDVLGLDWIQYVMVSDPSGFQGEITGIVDVAVPEPGTLVLLVPLAFFALRRTR